MQSHQDLIPRLWTAARAMFARMRAAIGEALAARERLSLDQKHAVRTWLAPLETMARKIVLIHALALLDRGDTLARANSSNAQPRPAPKSPRGLACEAARSSRAATLRLWPRCPAEGGAHAGRDHAALAMARCLRRSEPERVARRVDALARILARPLPAARRLARALAAKPWLALKLAVVPTPRSSLYREPEYAQAGALAFNDAYDWGMRHDTS